MCCPFKSPSISQAPPLSQPAASSRVSDARGGKRGGGGERERERELLLWEWRPSLVSTAGSALGLAEGLQPLLSQKTNMAASEFVSSLSENKSYVFFVFVLFVFLIVD